MSRRYVSFMVGKGRYCVPVDQVAQILRPDGILQVPEAPAFVAGVITVRGDVIPVVKLISRLGLEADPEVNASRTRVIVIRVGSRTCGLSVDDVREIVDIDETKILKDLMEAPGTQGELVVGVAVQGENHLRVLDLPRVLGAGRDLQGASSV